MFNEEILNYVKRFSTAKAQSDWYINLYKSSYHYAVPNRDTFYDMTPGQIKNATVYDTTLVDATTNFTSLVHNTLTPLNAQWAKLTATEADNEQAENLFSAGFIQEEKQTLSQQLDKITNILFEKLNTSNFDLAINEAYYDLAIGTACLQIREGPSDDEPFIFEAIPINHVFLEEGPNGTIETVWREYTQMPVRNILPTWPNAKLNETLRQKVEKDDGTKVDLIEGTIFIPPKNEAEEKQYRYIVLETTTRTVLVDEVFKKSSPWVIFRWGKRPGEVYGRGPVVKALPTALTLNKHYEFKLKSAETACFPSWMAVTNSIMNLETLNIEPNTIYPVDMMGMSNEWPIKQLTVEPNLPMSESLIQDMRAQINSIMLVNPIGPVNEPVKTATEISLRQQMFLEKAAPAFGRLQVEGLSKIIKRCLYLLQKKNIVPQNLKFEGKDITIEYESPIVQSQGLKKAQGFMAYLQMMQNILGQQMTLGVLNIQDIPFWLAENLNVDLSLIKGSHELQKMIENLVQEAKLQAPSNQMSPEQQQQQQVEAPQQPGV